MDGRRRGETDVTRDGQHENMRGYNPSDDWLDDEQVWTDPPCKRLDDEEASTSTHSVSLAYSCLELEG